MVNQERRDAWKKSCAVMFHGFPEWSLPADQTWKENPFNNNTWKLWYHCLTWLYVPGAIFDETGEDALLLQIRNYSLDWMSKHASTLKPEAGDMAWDDHAIAYRSSMLVYLYKKYFHGDQEWTRLFFASMAIHASRLHSFLYLPEFSGNNHGVFHCFALLNLAAALPELGLPAHFRADAERRLFELLDEMIDWREGVTREQALEYQYIALELAGEVVNHANLFGYGATDQRLNELKALLTRMVDFAYAMRWPDGTVPAIGDTWLYWNGWSRPPWEMVEHYTKRGHGSEVTKALIQELRQGTRSKLAGSFDSCIQRRSGYLLITGSKPQIWSILMKGGPPLHSHGHQDHLSIQYFIGDELVLVDSGGPYKYSDPLREYFTHPRAHNTLTFQGQSGFPFGVSEDSCGAVVTDTVSHVGGTQALRDGVSHTRNAIYLHESGTLVVLDAIDVADTLVGAAVQQYWHFAPKITLDEFSRRKREQGESIVYSATGAGGNKYGVHLFSDTSVDISLIQGQTEPRLQGWVTTKVGEMTPAPVLQLDSRASAVRHLSALVLCVGEVQSHSADIFFSHDAGRQSFHLTLGDVEWDVSFDSHRLTRAVQSNRKNQ